MFEFNLAMDLGTSSVLIYRQGKGILLREPSVVAVGRRSGQVVACGRDAQRMLGRTPEGLLAVHPLSGGVISDCEMAGAMVRTFLKRLGGFQPIRPNVIVGVPPLISELEERAVIDAGMQAGASRVYLMEEPVAAAAGAGLASDHPQGTLLVDIGGGTTDLSVISMGAVVCALSVRIAGNACDAAIRDYLRDRRDLLIGLSTAEQVKWEIGGVMPREEERDWTVRGRRLSDGLPGCEVLRASELVEVLRTPVMQIVQTVRALIEQTPPELAGDLTETGVVLLGGGARLYGLDALFTEQLRLKTIVADDPEACVVLGAAKRLAHLSRMKEGTINLARRRLSIF